jgi:hypothetical protein
MTSLFFSHVYSHARGQFDPGDQQRLRWEEEGIDRFILEKAPKMLHVYGALCENVLGKDNVLLVKYETLTSNYSQWLDRYLRAFGHFVPRTQRLLKVFRCTNTIPRIHNRMYKRYWREFTPPTEDVRQHKRQLTPGDYRRKLSAATIRDVNRMFADVLDVLGYQDGQMAGKNVA